MKLAHNVKEVAKMLGCSYNLVYEAVRQGKLPHLRVGRGRGRIFIPHNALVEWLEENAKGHKVIDL